MGIFHANDHCLHLVEVCCFVSLQADDGYLYPLERAFFYIQKPPTLLVHDEIESVEFLRQGGGMLAASAKTFDLSIRMQGDQVHACDTYKPDMLGTVLCMQTAEICKQRFIQLLMAYDRQQTLVLQSVHAKKAD